MSRPPMLRKTLGLNHFSTLLVLLISCAILCSTLVKASPGANAKVRGPVAGWAGQHGGERHGPKPIDGPPGVGLPNTDAVLRRPRRAPIIQPAIPSTQRPYRHPRLSGGAAGDPRHGANDISNLAAGIAEQQPTNATLNPSRSAARERRARRAHAMLPQSGPDFPAAMLDPNNRTGGTREDLLSGNYNWALGILGLSGRAGMDLDLSLSYNSLATWIRSGNFVDFDYDNGFPTPGFRLSFPVVDGYLYYNTQASAYYYLLFTPSGGRVELRRVAGTSNVYEAMDSSYLQLTDNSSSGYLLLRSADGTQLRLVYSMGQFRCTEVKDRNGNYITINYNSYDTLSISTIVDTLGRTITFNYDGNGNLGSITQPWHRDITSGGQQTETHTWASFSYGTQSIANNFSGLTVYGPVNQSITVLTAVSLPDGSQYSFDYNNYGQVTKITCKWSYSGTLTMHNYVIHDFATGTNDCPRISARRDWAAHWNGDTNEVPTPGEEAVTHYGSDTDGARTMTTPPYGDSSTSLIYKEYYGTGYQSGLVTQAEWWYGGSKKKYATTTWTQDNTSASYLTNPRPTETNIYDTSTSPNRRLRTGYGYYSYTRPSGSTINLKTDQNDYLDDATNIYRHTHLSWQLDSGYLSRGFTGLLHAIDVYDGSEVLKARTTLWYDYGGSLMVPTTSPDTPTQHDTSFDSSYLWRGNVSLSIRCDVANDPDNTSGTGSQVYTTYNTSGSAVAVSTQHTATQWNTSTFSYGDPFSDGSNHNAFAYPTTATDPDNNNATVQYNYDMGVPFRVQGPPPANPSNSNQPYSQWATHKTYYDQTGRTIRAVNEFNGAYQSFYHDANYVLSWATINNVADEALSLKYFDGHGRNFASLTNHPNSTGGYIGQWTIYDVLGRGSSQSTPTEINGSWQAVGDDATSDGSFPRWAQQTYDWKNRPLVTTNTDGTQKSESYDGCGCAGAVVTLQDEVGRTEKIYSDVLGRITKTETYNGSSIYATTTNTYNVRDQIEQITQYDGAAGSSTHQDTTMSFDGYGRLASKHVPEQRDANGNLTYTTFTYNKDDTVHTATDGRQVTATYGYNGRNQVTSISYPSQSELPSTVAYTPNSSFTYDAAGNRLSATQTNSQSQAVGSNSYQYDPLSRLTSESYQFADLSGSYALNYSYNLANELTSLAIPFTSQTIGYSYDNAGRLNSMSASGFQASYSTGWPNYQTYTQSLTSFMSSITYRAWGGRKSATYGNTVTEAVTYNSRMEPASYTLGNLNYTNGENSPQSFTSMAWTYDYYDDGRVEHAYDSSWHFWDRYFTYDHVGRLHEADTNRVANGLSWDTYHPDPYKQTSTYDVWNNLKLSGYLYNNPQSDSATYTNNRRSDSTYDNNGMVLTDLAFMSTYGAASESVHSASQQQVGDDSSQWPHQPALEISQSYEANGRPYKRTQVTRNDEHDLETQEYLGVSEETMTDHYLYSSVLGSQVVDISSNGQTNVWVFASGQRVATATAGTYGNTTFEHHNPASSSRVTTNGHSSSRAAARQESDPLTAPVPLSNPGGSPAMNFNQPLMFIGGDPSDYVPGFSLNGMPVSRAEVNRLLGKMGVGGMAFFDASVKFKPVDGWPSHFSVPYGYTFGVVLPEPQKRSDSPVNTDPEVFKKKPQAPAKSACANFVDELVGYAYAYSFGSSIVDSDPVTAGRLMGAAAKYYYGKSKAGGEDMGRDLFPTDGFKDEFINGGQGADVYKHMMGQAGAIMIGDEFVVPAFHTAIQPQGGARLGRTGNEVAKANLDADIEQTRDTNNPQHAREAVTEVHDDYAGQEIGNLMRDAMNGKMSMDNLRQQIFNKICSH